MINMTTFFSSQSIGGTVYIPYSDVAIIVEDNILSANLVSPVLTIESNDNIIEANLQEDIFQAILYDDREGVTL